jgi:hypothetical protein
VLLAVAAALVVSAVFLGMSQSSPGCAIPVGGRGPLAVQAHTHGCRAMPQIRSMGAGHGP